MVLRAIYVKRRLFMPLLVLAVQLCVAAQKAHAQEVLTMPKVPGSNCSSVLELQSRKNAEAVEVNVRLEISSPRILVWETMTDYGNAARFIPNLRQSEASPIGFNKLLVKQIGWVGWEFVGTTVRTDYEVDLDPASFHMKGKLVSGDVKSMVMFANLTEVQRNSTVLQYAVKTDPGTLVPNFLAERILRQQARESFEALAREMLRRTPSCQDAPSAITVQ